MAVVKNRKRDPILVGIAEFPMHFRTYFSGNGDVHGCDLDFENHGQIALAEETRAEKGPEENQKRGWEGRTHRN